MTSCAKRLARQPTRGCAMTIRGKQAPGGSRPSGRAWLRRSTEAREERGDCLDHEAKVQPQRPAANVGEVKTDHLLVGEVVAAADLPVTGHTGKHAVTLVLEGVELLRSNSKRTRTHQRHRAHEDVDQLGQLIDGGASHQLAETSDTVV